MKKINVVLVVLLVIMFSALSFIIGFNKGTEHTLDDVYGTYEEYYAPNNGSNFIAREVSKLDVNEESDEIYFITDDDTGEQLEFRLVRDH